MPAATAACTVATHSSTVVLRHSMPTPPPPRVSVETGGSGPKVCCCMSGRPQSILAVGIDCAPADGDLIQLGLEIARQRAFLGGAQAVGQLLGPAGAHDPRGATPPRPQPATPPRG